MLILLPVVWMIWISRKRAFVSVLVCGAAFTLCVLMWTARNFAVSGKPIPFAASSGISSWVSAEQYRGKFSYALPQEDWNVIVRGQDTRRAILKEHLSQQAKPFPARSIQSELEEDRLYRADAKAAWQDVSFSHVLAQMPARTAYLWANDDEVPWQGSGLWSHGLLWGFFALGIFLWRRQKHATAHLLLLLWVPAYLSLIHLVFHVENRYSYPGRPFLILLAVFGAAALFNTQKKKQRRDVSTHIAPE